MQQAYREKAIEILEPEISVKVNEARVRNSYLDFCTAYDMAVKELDTEIERIQNELIDQNFKL